MPFDDSSNVLLFFFSPGRRSIDQLIQLHHLSPYFRRCARQRVALCQFRPQRHALLDQGVRGRDGAFHACRQLIRRCTQLIHMFARNAVHFSQRCVQRRHERREVANAICRIDFQLLQMSIQLNRVTHLRKFQQQRLSTCFFFFTQWSTLTRRLRQRRPLRCVACT
jgi:hypothetical protein